MWHVWENIGAHTVMVGRSDGKRPPGRTRCRWEDNINKTDHARKSDLGAFVQPVTYYIRITYSERGSVALGIHHTMRMLRPILS